MILSKESVLGWIGTEVILPFRHSDGEGRDLESHIGDRDGFGDRLECWLTLLCGGVALGWWARPM